MFTVLRNDEEQWVFAGEFLTLDAAKNFAQGHQAYEGKYVVCPQNPIPD